MQRQAQERAVYTYGFTAQGGRAREAALGARCSGGRTSAVVGREQQPAARSGSRHMSSGEWTTGAGEDEWPAQQCEEVGANVWL